LRRYSRTLARILKRFPWIVSLAYVVYRALRPKVTLGVAAVIFNESGEVLMVEHIFHPLFPWGLPGGWVEAGEHPETAIVRELYEELNVTATIEQLLHSARVTPSHLDFAYLCKIDHDVESVSLELLDFQWCSPQQLPHMVDFQKTAVQKALQFQIRQQSIESELWQP
jgi:8-oxo-dGTP pyrophosphatase MutT (NUDIX family)